MKFSKTKQVIGLGVLLLSLAGCSETLGNGTQVDAKETEKKKEYFILDVVSVGDYGYGPGVLINDNGAARALPLKDVRLASNINQIAGLCITGNLRDYSGKYIMEDASIAACTPEAK